MIFRVYQFPYADACSLNARLRRRSASHHCCFFCYFSLLSSTTRPPSVYLHQASFISHISSYLMSSWSFLIFFVWLLLLICWNEWMMHVIWDAGQYKVLSYLLFFSFTLITPNLFLSFPSLSSPCSAPLPRTQCRESFILMDWLPSCIYLSPSVLLPSSSLPLSSGRLVQMSSDAALNCLHHTISLLPSSPLIFSCHLLLSSFSLYFSLHFFFSLFFFFLINSPIFFSPFSLYLNLTSPSHHVARLDLYFFFRSGKRKLLDEINICKLLVWVKACI